MIENEATQENMIDDINLNKSKRFWKYFWSTIILMAIIFILLNVTASKKLHELSQVDREAKLESILSDFKQKYPSFIKITKQLNSQSIEQIKGAINNNVENAYRPLYGQIDKFSDFHYSVTGEYTELFTLIFGKVQNILINKLFNPVQFNQKLDVALENINNESLSIIKEQLTKIKSKIRSDMKLNNDEMDFLFIKILKFSQVDMENRFTGYTNNLYKGMGLGVGAGSGAMMTKLISKKITKVISQKIATKVAVKGGAKLAATGAGALAGAEAGLFCGPGAWLCSPAGAVVGGVIGWFATDKIIVEVDEFYNDDEFKSDVRNLINQQKETTKYTLYSIYTNSFNKLSQDNTNNLESLKSKQIKNIIAN